MNCCSRHRPVGCSAPLTSPPVPKNQPVSVGNAILPVSNFAKKTSYLSQIQNLLIHVEIVEKILEVAETAFSCLSVIAKAAGPVLFKVKMDALAAASHEMEHFLHAFCVVGDVIALRKGEFLVYKTKTKVDWLGTLGRTAHFASNLFGLVGYLSHMGLLPVASQMKTVEKVCRVAGYSFYLMGAIEKRVNWKDDPYLKMDALGLCSELLAIGKKWVVKDSKLAIVFNIAYRSCVSVQALLALKMMTSPTSPVNSTTMSV